MNRQSATLRYQAWKDLLDFSTRLALAGMKAQGLSSRQAWLTWCKRWVKAASEHQQANRRIARRLHAWDKAT